MAIEPRTRLVTVSEARLLVGEALLAVLGRQPDVAAAYVFGSRARRDGAEGSDLDVALILVDGTDPAHAFERRLELLAELNGAADAKVDVVVLNHAPNLLQYEAISSGVLCYDRDHQARTAFEVRVGKMYADSLPARRFFRDALIGELETGGLGGRE